jgi:hypothetical protein
MTVNAGTADSGIEYAPVLVISGRLHDRPSGRHQVSKVSTAFLWWFDGNVQYIDWQVLHWQGAAVLCEVLCPVRQGGGKNHAVWLYVRGKYDWHALLRRCALSRQPPAVWYRYQVQRMYARKMYIPVLFFYLPNRRTHFVYSTNLGASNSARNVICSSLNMLC